MIKQHPGKLDGELGVLISLIVSIWTIILAVAGWGCGTRSMVSWEQSYPWVSLEMPLKKER
jgi:hypothetical protein